MLLVDPATYLSVERFKTQANDYELKSYSDSQLEDLLVRASGKADSYMCRTYLPTEITEEFEGEGTQTLELGVFPLIYVKSVQLVMPGFAPFTLPVGQLLIDYQRGQIKSWSPMIFQSLGISTAFPRNGLPIVIDYAYGFGYPIAPPSWTYAIEGINGAIPAGEYFFAISSRTQSGESEPSAPQQIALTQEGGIQFSITPQPGAFTYRIYGGTSEEALTLLAESPATNYGTATMLVSVLSLAPPPLGALPAPTADTSAWPLPNGIVEATRLYALSMLYEQNNAANRGLYQQRSEGRTQSWRSTEGTGGLGHPLMVAEAQELLNPYVYRGIL